MSDTQELLSILDTVMEVSDNNVIYLDSRADGRITHVNLYTDRAKITRTYTVDVLAGRTQFRLTYLPTFLDTQSVRVEVVDRSAKIEDVVVFRDPEIIEEPQSLFLQELGEKLVKARATEKRCQRTMDLIHSYIDDRTSATVNEADFGETLDKYDTMQKKWETNLAEARKEIEKVDEEFEQEYSRLEMHRTDCNKLRANVFVGVCANESLELEILVTYMVVGASWRAAYNMEVDMQAAGPLMPVALTYQALITQETGEFWENISLILETGLPASGLSYPGPWMFSHQHPSEAESPNNYLTSFSRDPVNSTAQPSQVRWEMNLTPNIGNTVNVPGVLSILTGEQDYCVKIVDLEMEAKMSWACVPICDHRAYLEAEIVNSSKYTLLPGCATVFVNNSLISYTAISAASVRPKEIFRCSLGADNSLRVTRSWRDAEDPVIKSRFFKKRAIQNITQQITIQNTKSIPLHGVRVTDYIPVSFDAEISIDLISPPLAPPPRLSTVMKPKSTHDTTGVDKKNPNLLHSVGLSVSDGVRVMWKGEDVSERSDVRSHHLGKDGMIDWLCDLPAFGSVDLLSQWKITTTRLNAPIHSFEWR